MISVIIPTYNREAYLGGAIQSVLIQESACGEIIIVDDGSCDNTAALVTAIARDARTPIRYLYQENQGAAAARNLGVMAAKGELLSFLDSDDRFTPDKLARQKQAMEKNPHYLVSHTREIWYRRGMILNQKKKHQPPHGEIFANCLEMCVVGMSTVMARRDLFARHGLFAEELPCCEDYDFWLRVSSREQFLLVDHPLTVKNGGRADQLSAIHRLGMDRFRIQALCTLLDKGHLTPRQYAVTVQELVRKCTIYGNGCFKHGREEEGRRYLELPHRYPPLSGVKEEEKRCHTATHPVI